MFARTKKPRHRALIATAGPATALVVMAGLLPALADHRPGHNPGGGGGGGGGNQPPADPAIAYTNGGVMVMNADGSNQTTIYAGYASTPSWSPDGDRIAFKSSNGLWTVDVAVVNGVPTGSNAAFVAGTAGEDFSPKWSPAGDQILFFRVDDFDPRGELMVIPPSGGTPSVVYTPPPGYAATYPTWSPDASEIAFIEVGPDAWLGGPNDYAIKVLDLATQQVATVYGPQPVFLYFLDWARSQDAVAFARQLGDGGPRDFADVLTLSLAPGSVPRLIASGAAPTWSPDDSKLAASTVGRGNHTIYVYDLATGQTTTLATGGHPDWRRF